MREISVSTSTTVGRGEESPRTGRSYWTLFLVICVAASGICLLTGLVISLFTFLGIVNASRTLAYLTVATLSGSFVMMFLAAHGMDRLGQAEKARRREEFRERVATGKNIRQHKDL